LAAPASMRNAEWPSHVSFIDRSWRIPHSPAPFEHDRAKRKARWSKRQGFADARHRDFGRIALEPVENGGEGRLRRRYHVERDNHSQSLSAKVLPNIGAKFTMKEAAPSGDVPRGRWHSPDLNLLYLTSTILTIFVYSTNGKFLITISAISRASGLEQLPIIRPFHLMQMRKTAEMD
jgi:hypothetical protein